MSEGFVKLFIGFGPLEELLDGTLSKLNEFVHTSVFADAIYLGEIMILL